MKAKELKEILSNVDDNAVVVAHGFNDACINIIGASVLGYVLYLDSVQEFPKDWYDEDGLEIGYDYENDCAIEEG